MKRKKISKRSKTAWRKHSKVADVEEFLEDQRLEERLGLNLSSNDEGLYTIDTKPSSDVSSTLSKKERSLLKLANPRCFNILKPHTSVPDPLIKRNRVRTKEERKNKLIILKENERKAKGILKAKEKDAIREKELYKKKQLTKLKRGDFKKDMWEVTDESNINDQWIDKDAVVHNLRQTGAYLKKVSSNIGKKPSILPSVEVPHPGTSYNPSFEDHQNLLKCIVEKEQELIKRDKHLNRVTKALTNFKPDKDTKSWLEEMSQGLPLLKEEVKEEDSTYDEDYKTINPPVKNKKKTLKQKRKHKEYLLAERMKQLAKIERKKISDLHRLKVIQNQVNLVDKKVLLNKVKREKFEESKIGETKRLGSKKFEDADLDFVMPGELTGNLRSFRKESNLLVDRYTSLQKRNIVVPARVKQQRRAKTKRYVKPGHKDDWKNSVAGLK